MSDTLNPAELPPLPKAQRELIELHQPTTYTTHVCTSARYTAEQMRDYALAAIAADRAQRATSAADVSRATKAARNLADIRFNELLEANATIADLRAQLAQQGQGEPVAWRYRPFSWHKRDENGNFVQGESWLFVSAPDLRDAHSAMCGAVAEPLYAAPASAQPADALNRAMARIEAHNPQYPQEWADAVSDGRAAPQPAARAAVPDEWRKSMRDLVRVLRGVECGDDGQWKFIANVCETAEELLAASPATLTAPAQPDVEFKKLADTILQATDNGTRNEALRSMAALFDRCAAPAAQQAAPNIEDLVNRFLAWPLPASLTGSMHMNIERPIGTHLMNADEARAMFAHCLHGQTRPTDDDLWDETIRDRDTYHEWADKLAGAIAEHFDAYIGEHSNMNCPWAEALEVIEGYADEKPLHFAALLPGPYYMDPPDGGSVSVLEQFRRMAEDATLWRAHVANTAPSEMLCEHCRTKLPLHLLTCPIAVKGMAEGKKKEAPEPLRQLLIDLSNNTYFCGLHLNDDAKYAGYLAAAEKAEQALIELFAAPATTGMVAQDAKEGGAVGDGGTA